MSKCALVYFNIPTDPIKRGDFVKGDYNEILESSLPLFKKYCHKYNIELVGISKKKYGFESQPFYNFQMYEKNQIYDLFDSFDRILRIDTDILISCMAPNIFNIVNEHNIGAVYEDMFYKCNDRSIQIKTVQKELGDVGWTSPGYVNAGMIVASKSHRDVFKLSDEDIKYLKLQYVNPTLYPNGRFVFTEQTYFNWKLNKFKVDINPKLTIQPLTFKFNHSVFFKRELLDYKYSGERADYMRSYFLHYSAYSDRIHKMRSDFVPLLAEWNNQEFERNIESKFDGRKDLKKKNISDLYNIFKNSSTFVSTSADSVTFSAIPNFTDLKKMCKYPNKVNVIVNEDGSFTISFGDKFNARSFINKVKNGLGKDK